MRLQQLFIALTIMMLSLSFGIWVGQKAESQKYPELSGYKCEYMKGVGSGFLLCKKLEQ